jgi:hypothetical protein
LYYDTEKFDIWFTHDKKIGFYFYVQDGVESDGSPVWVRRGSTIIFGQETTGGAFTFDLGSITPTPGSWKLEMWAVNNNIPYQLLCTDTCDVDHYIEDIEPSGDIIPALDPTVGAIVGLIITIFMTLSPFIVVKALKSNIDVPSLVYAIMGALGVFISVMLGLFPSWTIPFILLVGVIVSVILYLMNKKQGGPGL